jgi:hypothetical protein
MNEPQSVQEISEAEALDLVAQDFADRGPRQVATDQRSARRPVAIPAADLGAWVLALDDLPTEEVAVPEWKGRKFLVRTLTADEKDQWDQARTEEIERDRIRARRAGKAKARGVARFPRASLVVLCTLDPATKAQVWQEEQIEALSSKSAKALDRLFIAAARLNGVTQDDIEWLEGN